MKRDFPANELKPLAIIHKAWNEGHYDCYGMTDGENTIGYAFFVKLPEGDKYNYLLDYFAIIDGWRGQGYGSCMLQELSELITDAESIILEVEDPETAADEKEKLLRERRIMFYLRNGYKNTGVTACVFGVEYRLMETFSNKQHSADEIRKIYSALYKKMIPAIMYKRNIKVD